MSGDIKKRKSYLNFKNFRGIWHPADLTRCKFGRQCKALLASIEVL